MNKSMLLSDLINARLASRPHWDASELRRLATVSEALGHLDALKVTADDVDDFVGLLLKKPRTWTDKRPLSGATVNRHISSLGGVFRWARRNRLIPRGHVSPTIGVERLPEPVDKNKFLTSDEVDRIEAAARVTDVKWGKLAAWVRVAADTGLRNGNLMDLQWGWVDFDNRCVNVPTTKNGEPLCVPLTHAAAAALKSLKPSRFPEDAVFGRRDVSHLLRRAARLAGIEKNVTPHIFRHTACTRLLLGGASLAQIGLIIGHKSPHSTRRYAHLMTTDALRIVDAALG